MGMDEVPLSVIALLCHEHFDAETAVRLIKLMGYGQFSPSEFDQYKEELRSRGINVHRLRRILQTKLARAAVRDDLRKIAAQRRQQRMMLASLEMRN